MGSVTSTVPTIAYDRRPLIAHVVYRFDVGGLENGVVNLINRLPSEAYRHAVIALTEVTEFKQRILRDDVQFVSLHKKPGQGFWLFPRLFALFRSLSPAIVHTRNLAALEASFPAWLAAVPARVHGEHGRDIGDLDGANRKYRRVRRAYRPFVNRYVALSKDLEDYLCRKVRISAACIDQIYNGVDAVRFVPAQPREGRASIDGCPFQGREMWLLGTVGRLEAVKDQVTLARAFVALIKRYPMAAKRVRLVIAGDGPQRREVEQALATGGVSDLAWLAGERADVPEVLRGLDCFVLPSLAEGISNTILEAMASGLPVVATRVGGNAELVEDGLTGRLVPAADSEAMASAINAYINDPQAVKRHGKAGRQRVLQRFSLERMVEEYHALYDALLMGTKAQTSRLTAPG